MELLGVTGKLKVIKMQFQQEVNLKELTKPYLMDNIINGDGDSEQLLII